MPRPSPHGVTRHDGRVACLVRPVHAWYSHACLVLRCMLGTPPYMRDSSRWSRGMPYYVFSIFERLSHADLRFALRNVVPVSRCPPSGPRRTGSRRPPTPTLRLLRSSGSRSDRTPSSYPSRHQVRQLRHIFVPWPTFVVSALAHPAPWDVLDLVPRLIGRWFGDCNLIALFWDQFAFSFFSFSGHPEASVGPAGTGTGTGILDSGLIFTMVYLLNGLMRHAHTGTVPRTVSVLITC